ncbi:unnamed protein product [Mycena citricolor]|uniref:HTH TFE/IIEalpha-type domain-containing protein n=1 Tax=Mycena citricolor TaxID=2018698 RepID=A0AAD2K211_9AGAR|nr:unnamed protein product [Mycena citricolor]
MATKEDRETLRLLVQHVSRAFYEPKYTIIMDQLARNMVLKDDDLAGRMGLQPKELNKVIATLSNDRLVQIYRQNELREGAQRATAKQYYFIDYEHFCNVVKWRIAKMRKQIDTKARNELDNKGYICPQCKASYTPLDVANLMDVTLNLLICEICHAEVIDNEDIDLVTGTKDRMQRFNHQMRFIRAGLQKSEDMVLPAFDVAAWVKSHQPDQSKKETTEAGSELKFAGSDGVQRKDDGVGIVISTDQDEATRRRERDEKAQAKRQQNLLPEWIKASTVSGQMTAVGIKELARAAAAKEASGASSASSSNDDILRGLGIVGDNSSRGKGNIRPAMMTNDAVDVKPVIDHEAQYWDNYYANLGTSAQATPASLGAPTGSDFGVDEEDDIKPNIEYLDSLNEYRKRSRSNEGVVDTPNKTPKLESSAPEFAIVPTVEQIPMEPEVPREDPIVYVNGTPMTFSQVTEAEHDLMTPDEYTAYFQVMQDMEQ